MTGALGRRWPAVGRYLRLRYATHWYWLLLHLDKCAGVQYEQTAESLRNVVGVPKRIVRFVGTRAFWLPLYRIVELKESGKKNVH